MSITRNFKADLIYGGTGTTKTSNCGRAALWYYQRTGKPTRWLSADGGGWEPVQSLVDEGIIVPWQITNRTNLLESIDLACQGYWPLNPDDPKAPMQKADTGYSLMVVEGLTSLGDAILRYLRSNHATMKLSQDASYTVKDGNTVYAGGNMAQYGFVQDRLYEFVMKTHMLGGDFQKVIWTALEGKGEEEGTKIPIFGPAIAGKKSTGKAGQWFGNMLHYEAINKEGTVVKEEGQMAIKTEYRMYLRPHAEAVSKIMFPAKVRAPFQYATELPDWMEPDLGKLFDKLDDMRKRASAEVGKLKGVAAIPSK